MMTVRCAVALHGYTLYRTREKEKKRKDYAFRRRFDEKPSYLPGCPTVPHYTLYNTVAQDRKDGLGSAYQ